MTPQLKTTKLDLTLEQWQQPSGIRGGDFVVIHKSARYLRIFMGDVTGHGDAAAAAAERIRPMIERDINGDVNGATLRRWSHVVHRTLDDRFVAFTYLEIDHYSGEASVIVAGNPAVIIRRDGGRLIEQLDANGMPLGLVEDDEWFAPSRQRITLGAHDEILCFTDGLTDTIGRHARHQFGINRVLAAITETTPRTPLRSLCQSIEAFADHSAEQDDLTLLCIGDTRRLAA